MASEHWPTYVVLTIYVILTAIVTIAAKKKNSNPEDTNTHVTKHFLGSKNFGVVLLTLTTFASVFSGYTVVGVPTEAGSSGFKAIRWMGLILSVGCAMLWLYPRLRRLSIVRDYESPGDFIQDRFKSRALSILVAILLCVPQILYIGINLFSLGSTLEALTEGELPFGWVVVICTVMILIFEALGGMRSVAYTDAVEAVVMVSIFCIVPIMLAVYYGGFGGQINNSDDGAIPCANSYDDDTNGCLNYVSLTLSTIANGTESALDGELTEYFLRTPSSLTTFNYVLFCIGGISFSLNPHICQRALTAKRDSDIRTVVVVIFLLAFVTMTPGLLIGITALSNDWEGGAFSALLVNFEERGGFAAFISYITLLAAIAGIMSTADSALIGVSNTMSVDIFKNHVFPDFSSTQIVYVGKAVSLVTMSLCMGFAFLMYHNPDEDYGSVYTIQQGLLWQALPAYLFGLYTPMSSNAVLTGTCTGMVTCIIMISVLFANEGAHNPFPLVDKSWSTFLAVFLNVVMTVVAHYVIFPGNKGDAEDVFSLKEIRKVMSGLREPVTYYGGALVWITFAICIIVSFHWIGEIDPELIEEYGLEYAEGLTFNGSVRNVVAGVPDYIFATLMWYMVGVAFGILATMQWDVTEGGGPKKHHLPSSSTHKATESGLDGATEKDEETPGTETKETEMVSGTNGAANGEVFDR